MKYIITGGGTGGHITPALAIADELTKTIEKENILFIGTKNGLEAKLIPKNNYNIKYIRIRGIKRTGFVNTLLGLIEIPLAILSSIHLILQFKANVVIGTGGYTAGPVVLAAIFLRKYTCILEQNSVPGVTNKILSLFVNNIFIHYKNNFKYFPNKKVILSGNPVSTKFIHSLKTNSSKRNPFIVTILGGSQGSRFINNLFLKTLEQLPKNISIEIIHQTGKLDYEIINKQYKNITTPHTVQAYFSNMPEIYSKSDLIICRAGAMTISELQLAGKACILIPLPTAADNHQFINAKESSENNAALMLLEHELTPAKLASEIMNFINNPDLLNSMEQKMKTLAQADATNTIINIIKEKVKDEH